MEKNIDRKNIINQRSEWSKQKFVGGVVLADFLLMRELKLDIVFHSGNKLVKEYTRLLGQILNTNDIQLILLANTEIECAFTEWRAPIYIHLCDEAYDHFKKCNEEYPTSILDLHITVLYALIKMGERERYFDYYHMLRNTYIDNFGKESYLYCRNWCYIINYFLLNITSDVAATVFEENMQLFSTYLREDFILYITCINIAIKKVEEEQKIEYMKEAIDLCNHWLQTVEEQKKENILLYVYGMEASYFRNMGNYDEALKLYTYIMDHTENVEAKASFGSIIVDIFYIRRDFSGMQNFFDRNWKLIQSLDQSMEYTSSFYSSYGMLQVENRNYAEAEKALLYAIEIDESNCGLKNDLTAKHRTNLALIYFQKGDLENAIMIMEDLFAQLMENPEEYQQSGAVILNNYTIMHGIEVIDNVQVRKMKNVLRRCKAKYSKPDVIAIQANLYSLMQGTGEDYGRELEILQNDLNEYYKKNPHTQGYLRFLMGEYSRSFKEGDESYRIEILEQMAEELEPLEDNLLAPEHINYVLVQFQIDIMKHYEYSLKRQWEDLWEEEILTIFRIMSERDEWQASLYNYLRFYISLFVSVAKKYLKDEVTEKKLCQYILNFKFWEEMYLYHRKEFCVKFSDYRKKDVSEINLKSEHVIIEMFSYGDIDLEGRCAIYNISNKKLEERQRILYFGIECTIAFLKQYKVTYLTDISMKEWGEYVSNIGKGFQEENCSQIEKKVIRKISPLLYHKKRIYFCGSMWIPQLIVMLMRIDDDRYLSKEYEVVFGDTAFEIREDIEIVDMSDAFIFGMSSFDLTICKENSRFINRLENIPYTELEVEKIGDIIGKQVYLNPDNPKEIFKRMNRGIVHLSSHTCFNKEMLEVELVIGKTEKGSLITLKQDEILQADLENTKLVVLSACETSETIVEKEWCLGFMPAVKQAGAKSCIATLTEVEDGVNAFFMTCFYKNLCRLERIAEAFFETQRNVRNMTKKEILKDKDYREIGMEYFLQEYGEYDRPFDTLDCWAVYALKLN